jgi:hypothetical protein
MRKYFLIFLFSICTFFSYSNSCTDKSRQQIVRELFDSVEEWMGTPYVYGGNSKNGIDCSAFVSRVYSKVFNVKLPRTVAYQKNLGTVVTGNLQPGDLIFFDFGKGISHVGIFVFGEKFIHAASGGPSVGVVKCSLKEPYYKRHYAFARRIVTLPAYKAPEKTPLKENKIQTDIVPQISNSKKVQIATSKILLKKGNASVTFGKANIEVTSAIKKMLEAFWQNDGSNGVRNISIRIENNEITSATYTVELANLSTGKTKEFHLFDVNAGEVQQQKIPVPLGDYYVCIKRGSSLLLSEEIRISR